MKFKGDPVTFHATAPYHPALHTDAAARRIVERSPIRSSPFKLHHIEKMNGSSFADREGRTNAE